MSELEQIEREIASTMAHLTKLRKARRALCRSQMSERQERIRDAYVANQVSIAVIAERYNTSQGAIQRWARRFNWPRRSLPKCEGQAVRRAGERAA